MNRMVVDALERLPKRNRFLPGLRSWIGFRQAGVVYDRAPRAAGHVKQTWAHLVRYGMDAPPGRSHKPLRLAQSGSGWAIGRWRVSPPTFIEEWGRFVGGLDRNDRGGRGGVRRVDADPSGALLAAAAPLTPRADQRATICTWLPGGVSRTITLTFCALFEIRRGGRRDAIHLPRDRDVAARS